MTIPIPVTRDAQMFLKLNQIMAVFHHLFYSEYHTLLIAGADEPLYQPAGPGQNHHKIFFREWGVRSALHEVAHWCLAGTKRRKIEDYGYWYQPDGRSPQRQQEFFQVECQPQAWEWLFCVASDTAFEVSLDNLCQPISADEQAAFGHSVRHQALALLDRGLPGRGGRFCRELQSSFANDEAFSRYWQEQGQQIHATVRPSL